MPVRSARPIRTIGALVATVVLTVGTLAVSPGARAGTNHAVQISGFAFVPPVLNVTVGDTVTWTNLDPVVHTATSTSGAFDSGDLDQNESFSLSFTAGGTYEYLCTPHPDMTGTVIVQAAATAAPTVAPTAAPVATSTPRAGLPNVAMPPPMPAPMPALILGALLLVASIVIVARQASRRSGSG